MALADLYTVVPSTQREADEAAGLPVSSYAPTRSAEDSLSSFEDDLSLDGSTLGEDNGAVPSCDLLVEVHLPVEPWGGEPGQPQEPCSQDEGAVH